MGRPLGQPEVHQGTVLRTGIVGAELRNIKRKERKDISPETFIA